MRLQNQATATLDKPTARLDGCSLAKDHDVASFRVDPFSRARPSPALIAPSKPHKGTKDRNATPVDDRQAESLLAQADATTRF